MNTEASKLITKSGYYDGTPIAGPFKTDAQACEVVSRKRDPVEYLDPLEKE
ncbi:MAG: hypothetical protein MN733_05215 [Nitrososphaera sp.]|nr:hypothetical protein [Nitrososphaera sp.]